MDIFFYAVDIPEEKVLASEDLHRPVTPYTFGGVKKGIGGVLISESWEIHLRKLVLEVPP